MKVWLCLLIFLAPWLAGCQHAAEGISPMNAEDQAATPPLINNECHVGWVVTNDSLTIKLLKADGSLLGSYCSTDTIACVYGRDGGNISVGFIPKEGDPPPTIIIVKLPSNVLGLVARYFDIMHPSRDKHLAPPPEKVAGFS